MYITNTSHTHIRTFLPCHNIAMKSQVRSCPVTNFSCSWETKWLLDKACRTLHSLVWVVNYPHTQQWKSLHSWPGSGGGVIELCSKCTTVWGMIIHLSREYHSLSAMLSACGRISITAASLCRTPLQSITCKADKSTDTQSRESP